MTHSSIFNDVLGPVMRGPSSSHTAGSYHIGVTARHLLGEKPKKVIFKFHPGSSYAKTFRPQGVMEAYACAMMEIPLTDKRFFTVLDDARDQNLELIFLEQALGEYDHPNSIEIKATGVSGKSILVTAKSTGGGTFTVGRLNGWPIRLTGKVYILLVECLTENIDEVMALLGSDSRENGDFEITKREQRTLIRGSYLTRPDKATIEGLKAARGAKKVWQTEPVYFVPRGEPLFESAKGMVRLAKQKNRTLGETVLNYEAALLGLSKDDVLFEMITRLKVMGQSADFGFSEEMPQLRLLKPHASKINDREKRKELAIGGIHTQAAACAMAVMHSTCSRGVVCAAPTGGAAGTVPGVVLTLMKTYQLSEKKAAMLLFAAGGIGLITAIRATFSAEVAGCQVEIGVAGAMAAAAVVEFAGGSADQAVNAAAISLQNTMGSVCDHVQSMCEIPCHTRNAVAASSAFTCADLVLGGYDNPIDLDESIDASYSCGRMLPVELRCTAGGGLSQTPSALGITPRAFSTPQK